jgi:Zn finger protein HypA/HybF involved in hydrogenase expression
MVAEVFAGISAFKGMLDIARSFKNTNDAAARQGIAIELREQILTAQETQAGLIEKIHALETEITRFDKWDAEKQRYELKAISQGTLAYVLKASDQHAEPPHWLCANCYQNRIKAFLQYQAVLEPRKHTYACPACRTQIKVHYSIYPGRESEQGPVELG